MADELTFTGKIKRITFYNEKSAWGVLEVVSEENVPHSKLDVEYDLESNKMVSNYTIQVVGNIPKPNIGDKAMFTGVHSFNQKYKRDQYTLTDMSHSRPKTPQENEQYLRSIVTEKQAQVLLENYPNIVDDIINGCDEVNLEKLSGIGQITYDRIKDKVIENFAISDILSLLVPLGISFTKIQRLLDNEKNPQILKEKIINNPYFITGFSGISFKTADKIAIQLNPALKESEERLIAFVKHQLMDVGENFGHTWISLTELNGMVIDNVTECEKFFLPWLDKEKKHATILHVEDDKVGLKWHYDSEMFIWNRILELDETEPLEITEENILNGIAKAESVQGFMFTDEQKEVIRNMTNNNFTLLTGKSGTGKTTTARGLLNVYRDAGYSVHVAAFSAKASKRAMEATGMGGSTLHKFFGLGQGGNEEKVIIGSDVLFVDENSMNPLFLMKTIFEGISPDKPVKIILCGDSKQITPMGVANVFSDLLEKNCFNKNVLTQIQRQAADSGIIMDANLIRDSIDPIPQKEPKMIRGNKNDLIYVFKNDKEEIFRLAVSSYLKSVKSRGLGNTVLLVPFKTKGLNCTREFNKRIQRELNFENQDIKFKHGEMEFWMNDYVINIKNNYTKGILNGSCGVVSQINPNGIIVDFNGQDIPYTHDDIAELDLAYSLTPHRFQGSESIDCIVVMDTSHYVLLSSQWIYTAMTRARERCLIICDVGSYNRCLLEDKTQRNTFLKLIDV